MDDLIASLLEQIENEEARADHAAEGIRTEQKWWAFTDSVGSERGGDQVRARAMRHALHHSPVKVIAECRAKRRMIKEIARIEWDSPSVFDPDYGEKLLRLMALPYCDVTGYREEWHP